MRISGFLIILLFLAACGDDSLSGNVPGGEGDNNLTDAGSPTPDADDAEPAVEVDGGSSMDAEVQMDTAEEPDAPPPWDGAWNCTLTESIFIQDQESVSMVSALRLTTELVGQTLTVSALPTQSLSNCTPTFTVEGEAGALDAGSCSEWTEGEISLSEGGLEMLLSNPRPDEPFALQRRYECTPGDPLDVSTLTVTITETEALISHGPDLNTIFDRVLVRPGEPTTIEIIEGHEVLIDSAHPAGPPSLTFTPELSEACEIAPEARTIFCGFTMEGDRALDIEWPFFEPPRSVRTLRAVMRGHSASFSYTVDGEAAFNSCSGECEYEVDSNTTVSVRLGTTDVSPEINGRHTCQIVNSSSWSCTFPMEGNRTFTVEDR